jgi:hypothetical protein
LVISLVSFSLECVDVLLDDAHERAVLVEALIDLVLGVVRQLVVRLHEQAGADGLGHRGVERVGGQRIHMPAANTTQHNKHSSENTKPD